MWRPWLRVCSRHGACPDLEFVAVVMHVQILEQVLVAWWKSFEVLLEGTGLVRTRLFCDLGEVMLNTLSIIISAYAYG
jgi:hypothetical protein